MPYCRKCGAQLSDGARFCKNCGTDLSAAPKANLCPRCGAPRKAGEAACSHCGYVFEAAPQQGSAGSFRPAAQPARVPSAGRAAPAGQSFAGESRTQPFAAPNAGGRRGGAGKAGALIWSVTALIIALVLVIVSFAVYKAPGGGGFGAAPSSLSGGRQGGDASGNGDSEQQPEYELNTGASPGDYYGNYTGICKIYLSDQDGIMANLLQLDAETAADFKEPGGKSYSATAVFEDGHFTLYSPSVPFTESSGEVYDATIEELDSGVYRREESDDSGGNRTSALEEVQFLLNGGLRVESTMSITMSDGYSGYLQITADLSRS